jgi:hypothetical protein
MAHGNAGVNYLEVLSHIHGTWQLRRKLLLVQGNGTSMISGLFPESGVKPFPNTRFLLGDFH